MSELLASAAGMLSDPRSDLGIPAIGGSVGALVKALLPVVAYLAVAPLLWLFFRRTWRELDEEATAHRQATHGEGRARARRILTGTVTKRVSRHAGCSVFVVARREASEVSP